MRKRSGPSGDFLYVDCVRPDTMNKYKIYEGRYMKISHIYSISPMDDSHIIIRIDKHLDYIVYGTIQEIESILFPPILFPPTVEDL